MHLTLHFANLLVVVSISPSPRRAGPDSSGSSSLFSREFALLFSDGLVNMHAGGVYHDSFAMPVFCVRDALVANVPLLQRLALLSGGGLLDLTQVWCIRSPVFRPETVASALRWFRVTAIFTKVWTRYPLAIAGYHQASRAAVVGTAHSVGISHSRPSSGSRCVPSRAAICYGKRVGPSCGSAREGFSQAHAQLWHRLSRLAQRSRGCQQAAPDACATSCGFSLLGATQSARAVSVSKVSTARTSRTRVRIALWTLAVCFKYTLTLRCAYGGFSDVSMVWLLPAPRCWSLNR